jgi:ketose-bisphosphate aldolase
MLTLKEYLSKYSLEHKALPSFNIDSFEIYQAVESVVAETGFPCLVQLSGGEDKFIQAERLFMLVKKARIDGLPIFLNMDHGHDINRLKQLIKLGFDMVHFDGSDLSFDQNLNKAIPFIKEIKAINSDALVEVEFNKISLVDSQIVKESFTDPDLAYDFLSQTKADLFAISIGNLHGVSLDQPEVLDLKLFEQIKAKLPQQFFTLHGGSGVSSDQISAAIKLGVVKININTDLRIKFLESLRQNISHFDSQKIYDLFTPVITDLKKVVKDKFLCMM